MTRRTLAPALVLVAAAAAPLAGQVAVDADALMRDLSILAHDSLEGRAPGSTGSRRARTHIEARLASMGLVVAADTFQLPQGDDAVDAVNLWATIRGTDHPDRYLVVTAHYDHLGVRDGEIYNGADDNASGTAAVLALAEVLARAPPRHSVVVALLDAEEGGLAGAHRFVAAPPVPLEHVVMNVNLDMVARSEGELWAVGTTQYPALRPLVEAVEPEPPVFIRFGHDTESDQGADDWVTASDHAAFHRMGIPFLYFGVADHPDYHRPTDDVEAVDRAFYVAAVETLRRVLETLDGALNGARP
jgi:Zn-dependent M28 family amino/carboxypeptidase